MLSACGGGIGAGTKDTLTIVTHPGDEYEELLDAFREAHPEIEVSHTAARPSDISPRIISEQENGVYEWDVMVASTSNMNNVLLPAGAFTEPVPYISEENKREGSKWGTGELEVYTNPAEPYVIVTSVSLYRGIFVNRDMLSEAQFSDADDLLDPRFRGKIVIDDCTVPAHGTGTLVTLWAAKGEEFVEKLLFEQRPVFQNNVRITTEWVANGRHPIALGGDWPALLNLQDGGVGKNVDELPPLISGSGGNLHTQGIGIFKEPPHPEAVRTFTNWFLSKEGQTAWVEEAYDQPPHYNSRRLDVPVNDETSVPDWDKFDGYTSWTMQSGQDLVKKVTDMCTEARGQ